LVNSINDPKEKARIQDIIDTQIIPLIDQAKEDEVYASDEKAKLDAKVDEILGAAPKNPGLKAMLHEWGKNDFFKSFVESLKRDLADNKLGWVGKALAMYVISAVESPEEPADSEQDSPGQTQTPPAENGDPENESEGQGTPEPTGAESAETQPSGPLSPEEISALKEKINDEKSFYTLMQLEEIQGEEPKANEAKKIVLAEMNQRLAGKTKAELSDLNSANFTAQLPGKEDSKVLFTLSQVNEAQDKITVQIGDGETRAITQINWSGSLEDLPTVLAMEKGFELDAEASEEADSSQSPSTDESS
jgi:hypothetical protein